jgi:hypothetical protein
MPRIGEERMSLNQREINVIQGADEHYRTQAVWRGVRRATAECYRTLEGC